MLTSGTRAVAKIRASESILHIRFSLLKFICMITLVWDWAVGREEVAHLVVIVVAVVLLAGDLGSWGRYIWWQNLI